MASKRAADSLSEPSEAKKVKRQQVFINKYKETWPFMSRGKIDTFAFCAICSCDVAIGSGGGDDIKRHVATDKHKKNSKIRDNQKANLKMTSFFESGASTSATSEKLDLAVIRAEIMMLDLAVELNLSMNSLEKLNKAVKVMFPDSEIAKKFQCSRTKGTALVKEMAAQTTFSLGERMKQQPFTISTDGSNDRRAEKLFPLVVRTVDPKSMEVRSDVLAVPAVEGSATGENIFKVIQSELSAHDVPWENCLSLGCDNANVMVGTEKGVYGLMRKKHPSLYVSGCVCHLIHIAAQKGASCLPLDIGQLLIDIYYYLDKSSKRYKAFKCMQVLHNLQESKIVKHVGTRWLSIGKCLPRLISNWPALFDFFKAKEEDAPDAETKKKATNLRVKLQSPTNKLCAKFLADAIQQFDEVNTKLQAEEPLIHVLRETLHKFLRSLLLKFVKPSALLYKTVTEVDIKTAYNLKQKSDIIIGEEARHFIQDKQKHKLKEERIEEFYKSAQEFYKVSCQYILKKLPLSDELLRHAEVANPRKQLESQFSSLEYFLTRYPKLLHPDASVSALQLEFSKYQSVDIRRCISETSRVDAAWREISKLTEEGEAEFQFLPEVMLNILTIPHSSAHCERIFTGVRKTQTDFRGSMGGATLEALLVAKSRPGSALERSYTDSQLRDLKSANYRQRQSQE